MTTLFKTKMTSKGQLTIPKRIRDYLNMKPGDFFAVCAEEDIIVFKKIKIPDPEEMKETATEGRKRFEEYIKELRLAVSENIEWARKEHNKRKIENNKQ